MRFTWLSKIVSGSTVCPELERSHSAKADLAARLVERNASRKVESSASGLSLASWPRSAIQSSPMLSVMVLASAGFESASQRRGVGAVRAHDGEVGHADVFARAFFDQARASHTALVAGKAAPDRIEQSPVDLQDDL